ncbi:apyrase-like [Schistocerca gregaria]|uniref:apyrase-like n=1 Tax=Schistocerca gregaria TaxID=7010 RepID=UPI00211E35CE|nr:apyrase-like [Schistocerca gregaria]
MPRSRNSLPVVALSLLVLLLLQATAEAADGDFELHIVHLNDFHARFEPINSGGGSCSPSGACFGGIARVATEARRLIDAAGDNYLFLNAGDNFQGTVWYSLYKWNVTAAILNMLPWDAATLGNHEFDDKIAGLVPFLDNINFPMVVANLDISQEPRLTGKFNKSVVIERGGRRIGIVGYMLRSTPDIASTEKLIFLDEAESLAEEAKRLKEDGVDIIIGLSHSGLDVDRQVAAKVAEVDIIVGGHSHTLLYTGTPPDNDTAEDVYPVMVTQESGHKVAIVQAMAYTKYLGNLVATFDSNGELLSATGNPVLLDETVEEDPEILEALAPWQAGLEELETRKVGETKVFLDTSSNACKRGECNMGNFITGAMLDEMAVLQSNSSSQRWTEAPIAITNSGGIRASIEEINNGTITYSDLITVLPFENTIDIIEITGATLRKALEFSVNDTDTWKSKRQGPLYFRYLLHYSGLRVEIDVRQPVGQRVTRVSVLCAACNVPRYEPLKDDAWYPVAVNSFLAEGGDAFYMFRDEARSRTIGRVDVDVMLDYMARFSPIVQGLDGRTVVLS